MDSKERHDILNMLSPALTYTQNLRMGFYGEISPEQEQAARKIEECIKLLSAHIRETAAADSSERSATS